MEELDLKELFEIFWNRRIEILAIVIVFVIIGGVYSYFAITPKYTSYTTMVMTQASKEDSTQTTSGITQTDVTLNSKLVSTYSVIIKSKAVLNEVKANLKDPNLTYSGLKNSIKVKNEADTEVIRIEVTHVNPNTAAKIANEVAKVFSEKIPEIYNISNVKRLDEAEPSANPSNINHVKDIVIFAFIGAVVAIIYVLIRNILDNTIKTEEDVEKTTGLLVLASMFDYQVETKGGRK